MKVIDLILSILFTLMNYQLIRSIDLPRDMILDAIDEFKREKSTKITASSSKAETTNTYDEKCPIISQNCTTQESLMNSCECVIDVQLNSSSRAIVLTYFNNSMTSAQSLLATVNSIVDTIPPNYSIYLILDISADKMPGLVSKEKSPRDRVIIVEVDRILVHPNCLSEVLFHGWNYNIFEDFIIAIRLNQSPLVSLDFTAESLNQYFQYIQVFLIFLSHHHFHFIAGFRRRDSIHK